MLFCSLLMRGLVKGSLCCPIFICQDCIQYTILTPGAACIQYTYLTFIPACIQYTISAFGYVKIVSSIHIWLPASGVDYSNVTLTQFPMPAAPHVPDIYGNIAARRNRILRGRYFSPACRSMVVQLKMQLISNFFVKYLTYVKYVYWIHVWDKYLTRGEF